MKSALIWFLVFFAGRAGGHIGSPNVYFEGKAGPFPIRVVIRPPGVVPGLAEINVRILAGNAQRVTALPIYWDAGREGAPPADVAAPVRGQTNLYSTALWLMKTGAYSVDVTITGPEGTGTIIVPVNSVATARNTMARWFTAMLAALGTILFLSAVKLVGAAFGEAILEPGAEFSRRLRWRARWAMVGGSVACSFLILFGKAWWDLDDRNYRKNRLYQPVPVAASVRFERTQPVLRLVIDPSQARDWTPLIPDHGKLMHLFLVREPELGAFAHLHPVQKEPTVFDVAVPLLPEGNYRVYADVTHENGSTDTLTTSVQIPTFPESFTRLWQARGDSEVICSSTWWSNLRTNLVLAPDEDDSWRIGLPSDEDAPGLQASAPQVSRLADGYTMLWERESRLIAQREVSLRFRLVAPKGTAGLEPYMGMLGHAAVRRKDGSVFAHLHPVGTFSMASQQVFIERERSSEGAPRSSSETQADVRPTAASATHAHQRASTKVVSLVSFPYDFPQPGSYRIWVQLKSQGRVFTGVFDAEVQAP